MRFARAGANADLLFAEDFDDPPDADGTDAARGTALARDAAADAPADAPASAAAPPAATPPAATPPVATPPAATWADVEAARTQGRIGGLAEAATRDAALLGGALTAIAAELAASRSLQARMAEQAATATAELLLAALAAALPDLCAAHGPAEVAATIRAVLPALSQEPEIVVRVHPALAPAIRREIDTLAGDFAGQVTLQPLASLARGDVQLRWQYAQATRDTGRLCADIVAALLPAAHRAEPPAHQPADPVPVERGPAERGPADRGSAERGSAERGPSPAVPMQREPAAAQLRREIADVH